MKEYNWREEREKFKVPFPKKEEGTEQTGGGPSCPPPPIQSGPSSGGGVWKVIGVVVVLVLLGLGGGIIVSRINDNGKSQDSDESIEKKQPADGKEGGEVSQLRQSSEAVGKPSTDSAMKLVEVSEKYKHAVGVVVFWVKDSSGKIERNEVGTVWACAPNKFATNGHVAYGLKKGAKKYIEPIVVRKMLEKIDRFEKQEKALAEEKAKAEGKKGKAPAEHRKQATNDEDETDADENKNTAELDENVKILMRFNAYQKKVGDEVLAKQMEETRAFVLKYILKDMGCDIYINQKNNISLPVMAVQVHPQYDYTLKDERQVLAPDVAMLTVDATVNDFFPIADKENLQKLKAGMPVGFLGFPMEYLIKGNVNLESPVATMQTGIITAISDFNFKDAGFSGNYCIRHNLPSAGGASGSPIFNTEGQVVALLNGGNIEVAVEIAMDKIVGFHRTPNAALVEFGVRVDLLEGIGKPIPIKQWLQED